MCTAVDREGRDRNTPANLPFVTHCSFAYSAFASLRTGMSGSASFQKGEEVLIGDHCLRLISPATVETQAWTVLALQKP